MTLNRPRTTSGLTLIELMLAMTIMAIAGALVVGAFSGALRAWDTGLRSGREELVARIVLERIATQLRAALSSPARRGEEDTVAFDAGEDYLRFVTSAADGSPAQVYYGLQDAGGGRALVFREYPWPDKDFFGESPPRREERLPEVVGFSVRTIRRSEDGGTGGESPGEDWIPLDNSLPGRVTVEIQVLAAGRPQPRSYRVDVPILTQSVP